jgi:hypothetical protein
VRTLEEKTLIGRSRRTSEDNIKTDLKVTGSESEDCTCRADDTDRLRVSVNTEVSTRVP